MIEEHLKNLSLQHARFVVLYANYLNATKAYLEVYPDNEYASAGVSASRLLKDARIKEALNEEFKLRAMPKYEILNRLEAIAKIDINQFTDDFGNLDFAKLKEAGLTYMIKGISDTKFGKNFILHDQADALKTLAKIVNLYDDKAEVNVNINNEISAEDKLNERINTAKDRLIEPVNVGENSALTQV